MVDRKKIAITGASGFIGRFLVHEALKRDYNVYAIVRKSTNIDSLQNKQINIVVIDFNNIIDVNNQILAMPQFDYIIHGLGLTKAIKKEEFYHTNFQITKTLIESLKVKNRVPSKFLYLSSLASYGPGVGFQMIKAESKPHPLTVYGKSKLVSEKFIINESKIPYLIFRPTAVYGGGDKDFLKIIKLLSSGLDLKIGKHKQVLTFIYVKDLARLIFDSLESTFVNKSYFVTDGNLYSHRDFSNCVSILLNRKQIHFFFPVWTLKLIAGIAQFIAYIFKNKSLLRVDKISELSALNWDCDIEPLVSDFKFKAEYNLIHGLEETLRWYQDIGWLKIQRNKII
ncbi:MAG: NAD(P)-dependent oxidoreductase [Bacteroidetes bacterium]|nr:NAD(P)-dependent oxidoreductase [Bacteroidota bacterium]MBT4340261.1 NAD(P)-dependent oxidoreductase [Bacteroidota bacterium]MBT4728867.1 NAD(P)-dependent oxidoreductase [Bacteroidota bacterium]